MRPTPKRRVLCGGTSTNNSVGLNKNRVRSSGDGLRSWKVETCSPVPSSSALRDHFNHSHTSWYGITDTKDDITSAQSVTSTVTATNNNNNNNNVYHPFTEAASSQALPALMVNPPGSGATRTDSGSGVLDCFFSLPQLQAPILPWELVDDFMTALDRSLYNKLLDDHTDDTDGELLMQLAEMNLGFNSGEEDSGRESRGGGANNKNEWLLCRMHRLYQTGGHDSLPPTNAMIKACDRSREKATQVRAEKIVHQAAVCEEPRRAAMSVLPMEDLLAPAPPKKKEDNPIVLRELPPLQKPQPLSDGHCRHTNEQEDNDDKSYNEVCSKYNRGDAVATDKTEACNTRLDATVVVVFAAVTGLLLGSIMFLFINFQLLGQGNVHQMPCFASQTLVAMGTMVVSSFLFKYILHYTPSCVKPIFVKHGDHTITVTVSSDLSTAVESLKVTVAISLNCLPDDFRLHYAGKDLVGGTLLDNNIQMEATIYVVGRLLGGGPYRVTNAKQYQQSIRRRLDGEARNRPARLSGRASLSGSAGPTAAGSDTGTTIAVADGLLGSDDDSLPPPAPIFLTKEPRDLDPLHQKPPSLTRIGIFLDFFGTSLYLQHLSDKTTSLPSSKFDYEVYANANVWTRENCRSTAVGVRVDSEGQFWEVYEDELVEGALLTKEGSNATVDSATAALSNIHLDTSLAKRRSDNAIDRQPACAGRSVMQVSTALRRTASENSTPGNTDSKRARTEKSLTDPPNFYNGEDATDMDFDETGEAVSINSDDVLVGTVEDSHCDRSGYEKQYATTKTSIEVTTIPAAVSVPVTESPAIETESAATNVPELDATKAPASDDTSEATLFQLDYAKLDCFGQDGNPTITIQKTGNYILEANANAERDWQIRKQRIKNEERNDYCQCFLELPLVNVPMFVKHEDYKRECQDEMERRGLSESDITGDAPDERCQDFVFIPMDGFDILQSKLFREVSPSDPDDDVLFDFEDGLDEINTEFGGTEEQPNTEEQPSPNPDNESSKKRPSYTPEPQESFNLPDPVKSIFKKMFDARNDGDKGELKRYCVDLNDPDLSDAVSEFECVSQLCQRHHLQRMKHLLTSHYSISFS